jgi:hypothetical protein
MQIVLKDNQKFIAFTMLATGLMVLAVLIYLHPLSDSTANSGVLQILNMIIGAFIGAFGAAANSLFRTADKVTVDNAPSDPVPTTATPTSE